MTQRVLVLAGYFLRRLFFSLSGVIYVIVSLIYWAVLFPPGQGTPDIEYYTLVIGAFGAVLTFLTALTVAARANRAANYPLVVRLPSRVELLAAVLLTTLFFALLMQLLVAVLALVRGPDLALGRMLEIPPLWLAVNALSAVLAVHASDFVTSRWSRVYIFGILAILLLGQSGGAVISRWLALRATGLSRFMMTEGWQGIGGTFNSLSNWLNNEGVVTIGDIFGLVFWPFRAIAEGVTSGVFSPVQALAPAVIMLYATILFMVAADLFASKDLDFIE
jgi:hypothetical protein